MTKAQIERAQEDFGFANQIDFVYIGTKKNANRRLVFEITV